MTKVTIRVASLDLVSKQVDGFRQLLADHKEDLFEGAIYGSGVLGAIWRRTPQSDVARYGKVERVLEDGSVWRPGRQRLRKSVMPGGPRKSTLSNLKTIDRAGRLSYTFGSKVPYAKSTHEMPEGTNWTIKDGLVGNKYLLKPMMEYHREVARQFSANVMASLRRSRP